MLSSDEIQIGPSESYAPPERRPAWLGDGAAMDPADAPAVAIRLREEALRVVEQQAAASLDEIGGLLVGEAVRWQGRLFVDVESALPGERTKAGPAHVTFTAETWAALLERQERELPGKSVVGWYHSHPRMGIFLSDLDLSLHRHFFPQPWHVALVINGQDRRAGFFAWSGDQIRPVVHFTWSPCRDGEPGIEPGMGLHPFPYELLAAAETAPSAAREPQPAASWRWLLIVPVGILALSLWLGGRRHGRRRRRRWRRPGGGEAEGPAGRARPRR
jgi:proteasome lid subunit RPN8/RPN11